MFGKSEKRAISFVVGALLFITSCASVTSPTGTQTAEGRKGPPAEPTQMMAGQSGGASASETTQAQDPAEEPQGYGVAAGFTNVLYIPLKTGFCIFSGVVGVVAMIGTLGTRYDAPTRFVQTGCGGPWVLTGEDMERLMSGQINRPY